MRDQTRRASTTASSPNGRTKKSSSIAPCRTSFVQRNDSPSQPTKSASGHASGPSSRDARLLAEELPGERERRHGDDAVERQQQVRLGRADVHRDARRHARERRQREQPGQAQHDPRADRPRRPRRTRPRRRARGDARPARDRRRASRNRPPSAASPAMRRVAPRARRSAARARARRPRRRPVRRRSLMPRPPRSSPHDRPRTT